MEIAVMLRGQPVIVSSSQFEYYHYCLSLLTRCVLAASQMYPEDTLQDIITTIEREQEEAKKATQDAAAMEM